MTTTDEFRLMILNEVHEQRSDLSAEETRAALEETVAHEVAPEDAGIKVLVDKAPEQFLGYTFKRLPFRPRQASSCRCWFSTPGRRSPS